MATRLPRPTPRMRRGYSGQRLARRHLEERGYQVLEENYRCRWGELDIVARDGDCLVFVEVRTRTGSAFGTPEESVTAAKARRLALLAEAYRQDRSAGALPLHSRIDLVAVDLDPRGQMTALRHIQNAVEAGPLEDPTLRRPGASR